MRDSWFYRFLSALVSVQMVLSLVPCEALAYQVNMLHAQDQSLQATEATNTNGSSVGADANNTSETEPASSENATEAKQDEAGKAEFATKTNGSEAIADDVASTSSSSEDTLELTPVEEVGKSPPSEPVQPSQPSEPSEPSEPSQPSEPSEPSQPSGPSEPSEPSGPSQRIQLAQPSATSSVTPAPDSRVTPREVIKAESATENIVGEVFANTANDAMAKAEQKGKEILKEPVLKETAQESHDETYYEGSPRLRSLDDTSGNHLGFLVYRDSFLMISQEESTGYNVAWSEDKRTAYVTPAIDLAALEGIDGIVFLSDNVGTDTVLVFGGTPTLDGDTLVVPLADTAELTLTDLFSDGNMRLTGNSGAGVQTTMNSTEGELIGDHWTATIDNYVTDPNIDCWFDIDILEFKFDLVVHLGAEFDFDITSTGATNGRESAEMGEISLGLGALFTLKFSHLFEAEFDETPLHMAGHMRNSVDFHISPIFGMHVENFQAPVDLTVFEPKTEPPNKQINCYLGSAFEIHGGFLEIHLDLGIFEIHIGPVLSLDEKSQGGAHIVANLKKDLYDPNDFKRTKHDDVHLCAKKDEPGCYELHKTQVTRNTIKLKIDLFFASWEWNLSDDQEQLISQGDFYR